MKILLVFCQLQVRNIGNFYSTVPEQTKCRLVRFTITIQDNGNKNKIKRFFIYNLFTKSTGKIHCRYEAPREEPREAHGYLALGYDGYMVALSVNVTLWESVKES